jgi:hypothetical protein
MMTATGLVRVDDDSGLVAAVARIQRAAIMTFTDATERDRQIPEPRAGMLTYLADTGGFEYWDGSTWAPFEAQGAQGEPGPQGEQGDPGQAGGSILAAFWQYSSTGTSPPGGGQVRTNTALDTMWVAETDTDGFTREVGLGSVDAGHQVYVRGANGMAADFDITSTPTDNGTYWTFPVSLVRGSVNKGSRTQLNFVVAPVAAGIPPGGSTGQILRKTSGADYDVEWADP